MLDEVSSPRSKSAKAVDPREKDAFQRIADGWLGRPSKCKEWRQDQSINGTQIEAAFKEQGKGHQSHGKQARGRTRQPLSARFKLGEISFIGRCARCQFLE
jgi:hypothetical protein